MARGITEAEYATLKRKAARGVRFSDENIVTRRPHRTRRTAVRRAHRKKNPYAPALWITGAGLLLGIAANIRNRVPLVSGLGLSPDQGQNAAIGSALGNAIGAATGIPGLGQLGSVIGGLFGPSVHTDPMGIPQDTVQGIFNQTAQEMFSTINSKRVQMGLNPVAFPGIPTPGGAAMASWSTSIMASVLFEPSLNSSSQDRLAQLRENGTMDAAIAAMQSIIKGLQMPAPVPPPPQNYATAQGTPPATPPPTSYAAAQQSNVPTADMSTLGPVVAGGLLLTALVIALA